MRGRLFKHRTDIGMFGRTDTGQRTGGHIPDGIVTGFARRQTAGRQLPQHGRGVGQRDMMDLDRLACRDMRRGMPGILFQDSGNAAGLIRFHPPAGDFDPDHIDTVLALAIDALLQSNRLEALGVYPACEEVMYRIGIVLEFGIIDQH